LLVVIAIIAILAAILFPVFAQARQTACLSNLKQAATAVQMYTQDYDETFPDLAVLRPRGRRHHALRG
jgi:type II secretory pathway pseudopilin PulG